MTTEPWTFTEHADEPMTLRDAVMQACGGASACWEHLDGAGIFESDRCKQIAETLIEWIEAHYTERSELLAAIAETHLRLRALGESIVEAGQSILDKVEEYDHG